MDNIVSLHIKSSITSKKLVCDFNVPWDPRLKNSCILDIGQKIFDCTYLIHVRLFTAADFSQAFIDYTDL